MGDSIQKITQAKGAVGVAEVIDLLPSKPRALISNPSVAKKKKKYKEEEMGQCFYNLREGETSLSRSQTGTLKAKDKFGNKL
jgi:hypothetical protein